MIELDKVAMHFGDRTLFEDVSLMLPEGSFHFLTGPSGAGKTTLLKLCSLEMRPSAGRVRLIGEDTTKHSRDEITLLRRRIGVVHQDSAFVDHLTVAENVLLPISVTSDARGLGGDLNELLDWVGLSGLGDRTPLELSGGERQRVALARAIIRSPDIVLADEPTGNVDWDMSLRLLDLLIELNRLGKTIVCATHDLNLIRQAKARTSVHVLRLRQGEITKAGAAL